MSGSKRLMAPEEYVRGHVCDAGHGAKSRFALHKSRQMLLKTCCNGAVPVNW
jgi:hypothetical protein